MSHLAYRCPECYESSTLEEWADKGRRQWGNYMPIDKVKNYGTVHKCPKCSEVSSIRHIEVILVGTQNVDFLNLLKSE